MGRAVAFGSDDNRQPPSTINLLAWNVLLNPFVKLQLTKSKTIELNFSRLHGGKGGKSNDIVGVELFSGKAEGCPAVRLKRKKGVWHLSAAELVPPPNGELPEQWEGISHQPKWSLPHAFQSADAAIAANSSASAFSQSSPEAVVHEMIHGITQNPAEKAAASGSKRLGVRHTVKTAAAPVPPPPAPIPASVPERSTRTPTFPTSGLPVSENGRRFVVKPFAEDGFFLSASIPEFQALWLGRLLPEGRRPTAVSIQLAESALMASVLAQPEYLERKGSLLAVLVRDDASWFRGYKGGVPVLGQRCPGARGYRAVREAVKKTLGVGEDLVNAALEDSLVDPRPALEPFLHPILDQLELARAYLAGKHGVDADRILLSGLPHGAAHWQRLAEESLRIQLVPVDPFAGITLDKGVEVKSPHDYLVALGAALAAAEVEE